MLLPLTLLHGAATAATTATDAADGAATADATADELIKRLKKFGIKCPNPEGRPQCDWIIVDAGMVIIHLFRKETRDLYSLEKLWEISFETSETKLA